MKKFTSAILSFFMVVLCLTGLSGCSSDQIVIAYTVYPVGYILDRLAGNYIQAVDLSDGVNPIQTAQIAGNYEETLDHADLILQIGDLEPYWSIYSDDIKNSSAQIIDLSSLAAIYDFKRYTNSTVLGNTIVIESDWYEGTQFRSIDMYTKDMGLWLDPIAMTSMARTISEWLVEKDPINSAYYKQRFNALEADLVRLDSEYSNLRSMNLSLVTVTASYGNWQKDYSVGIYPLILSKYGALPTGEQLSVIENRIRTDGVKYIVREANMTPEMTALFEQVKADCGLTEISLSNLSTLTEGEYNLNKDYLTIMYDNLTTLESLTGN